ncbi:MAG TPA: replication initiator protein A [Gemmatimonadaceae bacterium]|nr:replication initiator protein A [Gemmatimonadaceae bacterium]
MTGMTAAAKRRLHARTVPFDRSLEELPLFRLSDTSSEEAAISYTTEDGGRWRVLASPGDRLPGTFDQDVYVELMRRYHDAGEPVDGALSFTLHAFLRSMGRQVDGRTYEQLRGALARLERTVLQSERSYYDAAASARADLRFTLLTSVMVERRRASERDQLALFANVTSGEPGEARVVLSPVIRQNLAARYVVALDVVRYLALASPVARRLYRLIEAARAAGTVTWRVSLERLREQLPLSQRYPSHLQRVLQPAHDMLKEQGVIREAVVRQHQREWFVDYVLGAKGRT